MKILQKFLSIFLIGSLLCFSMYLSDVFVTASDIQVGYVDGSDVNIRSEASTSSAILGKVTYGYVTVLGTKQGTDGKTWYHVTYQDITGYVCGDYILIVPPANDQTFEQQLAAFPESYKPALRQLHTLYPNWRFQADAIGLTLDEAVALEVTRKVVPNSTKNSWLSMGLGAYDWNTQKYIAHDTNWYVASRELIRYYMDPRNFLNATDIYTYMQLGYDPTTQTEAGLDKIIAGTFLAKNYSDSKDTAYGGSYSKVLMAAAQQSGVSPYVLASTVIQEQGTNGTSSLISGTYPGYQGYYNFFNVQAYGNTTAEKVTRGLTYAKNQGWSSRSASIIGGAKFCGNSYINAGQSTYFDMNFNIKHPDRIWHEYAGAPHYALACGQKIAKNYKDSQDAALDFKIPVYRDMPSTISAKPAENTLRNNYYFNSITAEGLTPSFDRYTYSYDLRMTGDKRVKVVVPTGASYVGDQLYLLHEGLQTIPLTIQAESGYTNDYILQIFAETDCKLIIISNDHEHSFNDWQVVTAVSCVADGLEQRTCTVCGETETRIISARHTDQFIHAVPPTCTDGGYDLVKCTACGLRYRINETEALGHNFVLLQTAEPTCTEQGYSIYCCERCGDIYNTDYASALGHDYQFVRTIPTTCVKDGYHLYSCTHCGGTIQTVISATGHFFLNGFCLDCGVDERIAPFDLNGDTKLNAADLVEMQTNLWQNEPKKSCDVNNDGVTNILDLISMKKKLIA